MPNLALEVVRGNQRGTDRPINLAGFLVGNAWCEHLPFDLDPAFEIPASFTSFVKLAFLIENKMAQESSLQSSSQRFKSIYLVFHYARNRTHPPADKRGAVDFWQSHALISRDTRDELYALFRRVGVDGVLMHGPRR